MVEVGTQIIDKHVKLTYYDEEKAFRISGIVKRYDTIFLTIYSAGREQTIPISRIIRIELEAQE
jgi:hypothetical protein